MNEQIRKRPFMVWVICLVGWLGAVSQVLSQILLISVTEIQADSGSRNNQVMESFR